VFTKHLKGVYRALFKGYTGYFKVFAGLFLGDMWDIFKVK